MYEAKDLYGGDSLQVYLLSYDPKEENKGVISPAVSFMQLHIRGSITQYLRVFGR